MKRLKMAQDVRIWPMTICRGIYIRVSSAWVDFDIPCDNYALTFPLHFSPNISVRKTRVATKRDWAHRHRRGIVIVMPFNIYGYDRGNPNPKWALRLLSRSALTSTANQSIMVSKSKGSIRTAEKKTACIQNACANSNEGQAKARIYIETISRLQSS